MEILIGILVIYTLIKVVLEFLQLKFVQKEAKNEAVILDKKSYENSAINTIVNKKYEMIKLFFECLISIFWVVFGFSLLKSYINSELILVMSFIVATLFIGLPFSIYETFVKDKKFGFSKMTPKLFFMDFIKGLALTLIFGTLFVWTIIFCIERLGSNWWIYAFIFSFLVIILINLIYPTLIAPMFNKLTPLEDGEFKDSIKDLLVKCGFKSSGVFVVDASKRDSRLNAYFGGFGATKRVVLFDTLIEKLSQNEILAVLGHELGHFKHKDILKNIVLMGFVVFLLFFIFSHIPTYFYESMGLEPSSASSIILFFMLFSPVFSFLFQPIISLISRSHEFSADEFGACMQNKDDMISALIKLGKENKVFPKSDKIYSFIYHSHPPLYERVQKLKNESI